jgi:tRNA-specific adenosine deaminase 2
MDSKNGESVCCGSPQNEIFLQAHQHPPSTTPPQPLIFRIILSMTQVKESCFGQLGLFATQGFEEGETILAEPLPLVRLAPSSKEESQELYSRWTGQQDVANQEKVAAKTNTKTNDDVNSLATLWDSIKVPSDVDASSHGTFKGMVQAGMMWMQRTDDDPSRSNEYKILNLYHPTTDSETEPERIVCTICRQAIEYLKTYSAKNSKSGDLIKFQEWETLEKILRIWACNSFQGGLVYDTFSRVNHSCNPNALVVANDDAANDPSGQRLVAATKIASGSEICISYLGLFLYADTITRRRKLRQTKYFDCQCQRCAESLDAAARTPCSTCHPRHATQLSMDEDVQYDDDQDVQYVSSTTEPCSRCNLIPQQSNGERLNKILASVNDKIFTFVDTYQGLTKSTKSKEEDIAVLDEHASLASTMMGAKHWTTNVMLLLHLDNQLSTMSQQMLMTQELPEIEDVAEAVDTLQRLYQFVSSLDLYLDAGHILGDVTVGVARMLVSLGDEKSQKYGAEWLGKIDGYVNHFGDEGLQKVVEALMNAWKKHGRSNDSPLENAESECKKPKALPSEEDIEVNKVRDEHFMRQALKVAEQALQVGEVPVGCVIVLTDHPVIDRAKAKAGIFNEEDMDGFDRHVIISHGANQVNATRDATRHAEIVAIDRLLSDGQSSDQLRLPLHVNARGGSNQLNIPRSVQEARERQWEDTWTNRPDCQDHWKNLFGWRKNQGMDELRSLDVFSSCELFVTCEPCIMCASALANVGIKRVVFGCKNDRFGGCGSLLHLHLPEEGDAVVCARQEVQSQGYSITSGVLETDAIKLLQSFYDRENFHAPDEKRKEKEKRW